VLLCAGVALAAAGPAVATAARSSSAASSPLVIEATSDNVQDENGVWHHGQAVARLGNWSMLTRPTLAGAIRSYGRPARCAVLDGGNNVVASWPVLGMIVRFYTLGLVPAAKTGCSAPASVSVAFATLSGSRWQTPRGLRIGMGVADIARLAPTAERHGSSWWIYRSYNIIGTPGETAPLVANMVRGRIVSFQAGIGAGGD
jgi:hypothetical protein